MPSRDLPSGAAVIVLGPGGIALGRRVRDLLPNARLHGPRAVAGDWDETYESAVPHIAALFAAGTPIVGLCASGILIRAVAPLLDDKGAEPAVVALAEDGSAAVPLLGGHHGANAIARALAEAFGGTAAITTAGDLRLGLALDEPPPGWKIADPERVKRVAAALLAGKPAALIDEAPGGDWLRAGDIEWANPHPPLANASGQQGIAASAQRVLRDAPQGALLSMTETFSGIKNSRHPEEAAKRPSRRTRGADPSEHRIQQDRRKSISAEDIEPGEGLQVVVTDRVISYDEQALVFHPPVLALGIGCERGCPADEIEALARESLAEARLAADAVAAVVSVELKADESGIQALARSLGVPARFFLAERLLSETERLTLRSEAAFRATGCWGVAEGAALAAVGPEGVLVVPRRQSRRATCAVARAPAPLDATAIGRPRGKLAVIGIGPGDAAWRTPEASALIAAAEDVVGYRFYLDLLGRALAGKNRHDSAIGAEAERVRLALDLAAEGRSVALVSSGDAGIYGLAALVFETLDRADRRDWSAVEITVAPGISAMQAAAARLGAPLGHDFCAISLSDLLTPWGAIRKRLEVAAAADFVIALYNPRSARRTTQLAEAASILLIHRAPDTPVAVARNLGRPGESHRIVRLDELAAAEADMLSLVLVGSSCTRLIPGDPPRLYTPRGYFPDARA